MTHAFALFDLGHALRIAGDDAGACTLPRDRLRIDNQAAAVLLHSRYRGHGD